MKKDILRKFFYLSSAFLMMWGVIFIYNRATDGFSVREMTSTLHFDPARETLKPTAELQEELDTIFSQSYRYLGKGCQCYAFASNDQKYVIKFFKHKHLRPLTWVRDLPIPKYFQTYTQAKIEEREKRIRNLFSSCKLAYEELSEETGVVFLHLNRTPTINRSLTIYDKLGIKHTIDLNQHEFVVQKKAVAVEKAFSKLIEEKNEAKTRAKIKQLADVVLSRCEKGIRDRDRSFVPNVAFSNGEEKAVYVDIGQFFKDESIKMQTHQKDELRRRLGHLRWWTEKYFPELIDYVDEEIARRL